MKTLTWAWILILAVTGVAVAQSDHDESAATQKAAPLVLTGDFTLVDSTGKQHTLSSYKGQYVVLEWVNFDCPFVKKHYRSGNMPRLQETYTEKGVVWLAVCSSAPDKQGYYHGDALTSRMAKENFKGSAYLQDPDGKVGKLYKAKTTPHMIIFNPQLDLIYDGAIDSVRSTDPEDISNATNYVAQVLDAAMGDQPIPNPRTTPYGCSVKY